MAACLVRYQLATDDSRLVGASVPSDSQFVQVPVLGVVDGVDVSASSVCQYVAFTADEYERFAASHSVDGGVAASFFSFGLTMVVGCYLVAHKIGLVLDFVRRS